MFGNILVAISGIAWTIVYIELIRKGFKEKACGMPLFALTLNFSWELIYAIDGLFISKSFILVQSIANVVWAFFDIFILVTWFKFGKQYMSENSKKYFIPYSILALIVAFTMQFAFYFSCDTPEIASIYSAYAQNVAMSIMFVVMLFRNGNTKGQSLTIAISKWIGTLTPTIYGCIYAVELGVNYYILLTGILCSIFDIIYIYFLFKFNKNQKGGFKLMKAIIYTKTGGLENIKLEEIETPIPNDNQVLIEVKACSLNISDYQRFEMKKGKIPLSTKFTNKVMGYVGKPFGAEVSGIVIKVGKNITNVKVGDYVFGKTAGSSPVGGVAEYALMDKERVWKKPENLSFEEASTISISFETALGAVRKGKIKPNQKVMVYGASGGVGLFVIQLVKAFGANVTGVCSTRNIETLKRAGCDEIIDYKKEDFTKINCKYDVILGINGCNKMKKYKSILKDKGVFVGVGNVKQAMKALKASFFSKKFTYYAGAFTIQKDYLEYAYKLVNEGKLKTFIDKIYPVENTKDAINYLLTNHAQGKVVIKTEFK